MNKKLVCMMVSICFQVSAMEIELDSSDCGRTTKPYKYGPLLDQQWCLVSSEDNQLIASWLQLMILKEKEDVVKKFKRSELWRSKQGRVNRYVEMLEWCFEKREVKEKLGAYRACFAKIKPDHRLVPGFGNMPRALLRPEILASKVVSGS